MSSDCLGHPLTPVSATDTILGSLPPSYNSFITNFHMHGMEKNPTELHGMLKIAEQDIKKGTHQLLMVHNTTKFKKSWTKKKANAKGKDKDVIPTPVPAPKPGPDAETICFYCKVNGHWKRNCNKWLASKGKSSGSTTSIGTLVVFDIYLADISNSSWVYDTGSVVHICNSMQGLKGSRDVARGEVDTRIRNKARVAALAVDTMQLNL